MKNGWKIAGVAVLTAVVCSMAACVPKDMEKGAMKMLEQGYYIAPVSTEDLRDLLCDMDAPISLHSADVEDIMVCAYEDDGLIVIWFNDKKVAKDFCTEFKFYEEEIEREVDTLMEYKVEGKVFYWGTLKAIRDFTN